MSLALASAAALPAQAESLFLVPYHAAEKPIVDAQGRKSIIIDFVDDAHEKFPKDPPPGWDSKASFHRPQVVNLVNAHAKTHGYEPQGMTTWVGSSTTAYLNEAQIKRMREDKSVKLLTENEPLQASSSPPWSDALNYSYAGFEWQPWGRTATNGKAKLPDSNRFVYVIDSGVAYHNDLGSVVDRVNVNCGGGINCSTGGPADEYPVVGCYAHATHVAGIVGATADNAQGVRGMYAGVKMISVAMSRATIDTVGQCASHPNIDNTAASTNSLGYALDYVFWRVFNTQTTDVPIVTLSFNGGRLGFETDGSPQTNRWKLQRLVEPYNYPYLWYYPGVFFVQSAGNFAADSCALPSLAYRASVSYSGVSSTDGIMVVGAINSSGRPVTTAEPFTAPSPAALGAPPASNFGQCIDVWAPGDSVLSTRGRHTDLGYYMYSLVSEVYGGTAPWGTSGWLYLSGTSMAAPHVAAAAAYLADLHGLTTPAAIEAKVRTHFTATGYSDPLGVPVHRVELP